MVQNQLKPEELARKYIDKNLEETDWKLLKAGETVPKEGFYALREVEVNGKFSDYVLYIDGKAWASVEAKKEGDESLEAALIQAVGRYARPLNIHYAYAANTKPDKWNNTIIHKTVITDIKPVSYFQKVMEGSVAAKA